MKSDIWYPFYPGDYHRDTQHLTTLEHGAYRLLIDACWCRGGKLPNDDGDLARIVGLTPDEWSKIKIRIAPFFQHDGESWTHNRVTKELNNAKENAEKQAKRTEAARTALQTKRKSVTETVTDNVTMSSSPSPSPSPKGEIKKGVSEPFPEIPPMSENDFFAMAEMRNIPRECAQWFWNEHDGHGWKLNGSPIRKVEPLLLNFAVKWRAKSSSNSSKNHNRDDRGHGQIVSRNDQQDTYEDGSVRSNITGMWVYER